MEQISTRDEKERQQRNTGSSRGTQQRGSGDKVKRDVDRNNTQEAVLENHEKEVKVLFSNVDVFTSDNVDELRAKLGGD